MSPLRKLALPLALIALLLSAMLPLAAFDAHAADATGPQESMLIDIRLDGPSVLGTGVESDFTIRIAYAAYPERIQNYSYTAKVIGTNTAGGKISPDNGTDASGVFAVKVTGVENPGKMTVQINATAFEEGIAWYRLKDFEIDVVVPVYISAVLLNNGEVHVYGVAVKMYVDDEFKEMKTYNISSNGSAAVNFTWVFNTLIEGKHTIKLVIDGQSEVVEFIEGNNVITLDVYYSESGNYLRGILVLVMVFIGVVLFLTFIQKSTKGVKK